MSKIELAIVKTYARELTSIGFQVRQDDDSLCVYSTDPVGFAQLIAGGVVDGVKKTIRTGDGKIDDQKTQKMEELLRAVIRGDRNINQRIREFFILQDTVTN